MRQHEFRLQFAIFRDHRFNRFLRGLDRIIAGIEETNFSAQNSGSARVGFLLRRISFTRSIVMPGCFHAPWLSPRSPNDRQRMRTR